MNFVPKISIIIPVYNVENYLCECLDSILNQTFQDFEIICIDDGSVDNSLKIINCYIEKDKRIKVFQQQHSGAGEARNKGIELAKGKYIQFLDSDDYFETEMLEQLYNQAEKFKADMVVCSARKVNVKGEIIESGNPIWPLNLELVPLNRTFNRFDFPNDIMNLFCVTPWNKLYLKSFILKKQLKFQNITSSNDVAFGHLSSIFAKKIVVFNKELINYRYNRSGSIAEYRAKNTINVIQAANYVKKFLQKEKIFDILEKTFQKAFVNHIRSEISICNEEQYNKFLKDLKLFMPDDWVKYKSALKKDYITSDYIKNFIGNKKVVLWGASLFIKNVFEQEKEKNPNILGFIDKNKASWGKKCGNYIIYSPDSISELKPDGVVLTVFSNNEIIHKSLKAELQENYPNIELLPNIFE